MTDEELKRWADRRSCPLDVARAIHDHAQGDRYVMRHLWAEHCRIEDAMATRIMASSDDDTYRTPEVMSADDEEADDEFDYRPWPTEPLNTPRWRIWWWRFRAWLVSLFR